MNSNVVGKSLDPMSQIQVEQEIHRLSQELTKQTEEHANLAVRAAKADTQYDLAHARALLGTPKVIDGEKLTVAEREAKALIAVEDEVSENNLAEAIYRASVERGRNLRAQLDALRTIAANVRAAIDYTPGRGS